MGLLSNAALGGGRRSDLRLAWPDVARGIAVGAMVTYHFAWDLSELRLIGTEVTIEPGWRAFAMTIAGSFLTLSGIGLVLAHGRGIRVRAFVRRLALLAGAALLVTVGTYLVFPESYVFFGILHAIALASVLALPAVRAPAWVAAGAAALLFCAPLVLRQAVFDVPILSFLGLGTRVPNTNDYVPVAPWAGFVFAGVALARSLPRMIAPGPDGVADPSLPVRALCWIGRHSLVVYLLHQPVLFGLLSGVAAVTGPNPSAEAAPFLRSCAASCAETGQPETVCRATCVCAVDEIKRADLWKGVVRGRLAPEQSGRVGDLARACFERLR